MKYVRQIFAEGQPVLDWYDDNDFEHDAAIGDMVRITDMNFSLPGMSLTGMITEIREKSVAISSQGRLIWFQYDRITDIQTVTKSV